MIETAISWLMSHPLQTVAGLALFSIGVGLLVAPGIHVLVGSNHPRC